MAIWKMMRVRQKNWSMARLWLRKRKSRPTLIGLWPTSKTKCSTVNFSYVRPSSSSCSQRTRTQQIAKYSARWSAKTLKTAKLWRSSTVILTRLSEPLLAKYSSGSMSRKRTTRSFSLWRSSVLSRVESPPSSTSCSERSSTLAPGAARRD